MKVAFVGTSCVGKTTLLEQYRQKFSGRKDVVFVEEAARAFFQANPDIKDRFSAEIQGRVQTLALHNEQEAHASGARVILCDRSVIDAVAYVRANGDKMGSEELLQRIGFWLPTYRKFLLLDIVDIPYVTDDIRREDVNKRQQFHNAFLELFGEKRILYELLGGTVRERMKRVDEILSGR